MLRAHSVVTISCPEPGDRANLRSHLIPLDPCLFQNRGRDQIERDIRQIVRSVKFEVIGRDCAFRLLGPETSYHDVDPHLQQGIKLFDETMTLPDILSYRSKGELFDLCLEDSWAGYLIADHLRELSPGNDLVVIHVDDHADMMPTLLTVCAEQLIDPAAGNAFDPASRNDWETAIRSGCVSIGNFVTPLYYSKHKVHVRHLNNSTDETYTIKNVIREGRSYDLIPGRVFAAVRSSDTDRDRSAGTYLAGPSARKVMQCMPHGRLIVHIDLDYFINDFNGNGWQRFSPSSNHLMQAVHRKMLSFFEEVDHLAPSVDRWIIATSPGFCSGYHWGWLLAEVARGIKTFNSRRVPQSDDDNIVL